MDDKTAVILLGHGSRLASANQELEEVACTLRSVLTGRSVAVAFLQMAEPSLAEAVAGCIRSGATRVAILPFFLFPGAHVREDIPRAVEELRRANEGVEILLAPHLGAHPKLAEIAAERLGEVLP